MTPKEQELRKAILSVLRSPNTLRSLTIADDIIAKARDCYAEELQSERMVTFKLSQQNEAMLQLLVETRKMHLRYEENRGWLERRDKIIRGDITP